MNLSAHHPLHLVLGLTIWSAWFVIAYSGLSVFCSIAPQADERGFANPLNLGLLLFTFSICVLLGALTIWCWRTTNGFPGKVSAGLYFAALIATLGVAAPVAYLPPCL